MSINTKYISSNYRARYQYVFFLFFFPIYIGFNHQRLLFVFISVVVITSEIEIACFDLVKNIIT